MKTFVLVALLLLPAALPAQVLIPSRVFDREAVTLPPPREFGEPRPIPVARHAATRPPSIDYKLRVIRPSREIDGRMLIGRPNSRYDYKILTPRSDRSERAESRQTPQR